MSFWLFIMVIICYSVQNVFVLIYFLSADEVDHEVVLQEEKDEIVASSSAMCAAGSLTLRQKTAGVEVAGTNCPM